MTRLERPDAGYAWVVAVSASIINMLLSGLSRMTGILYVTVLESYHCTREEAMLPFSVRTGLRLCSGPFVGIVGQRYGIRKVTFFGGLMAAAGAALSYVAPNIIWLTIFWGAIHGMGFAFANTLFQVVVNQYFEKHRATASGIALSGACVGSLGFPAMIESIIDSFGLAGGFLILGGVILHVLPPSLLLKSPPWVTHPEKYARQIALQNANRLSKSEKQRVNFQILNDVSSVIPLVRHASFSSNPVEELVYRNSNHIDDPSNIFRPLKGNESWKTKEELKAVCLLYRVTNTPVLKVKQLNQISPDFEGDNHKLNDKIPKITEQISEDVIPPAKSETEVNERSFLNSIRNIWKLHTNPVYVLICICMSSHIITFLPIITVIVDYAKDKGISEIYGKYLINALAIGDLIGRLCFGWVTDRSLMTIPSFFTLMLILKGAFIALFSVTNSFYILMLLQVLYGIGEGSLIVLFPVLVLKYVDMNEQAVAITCVGFLSGLVSFCIPPLIGYFRDNVGSYDGMFYLMGGISAISGLLWLLEPVIGKLYYGDDYEKITNSKSFSRNNEKQKKEDQPS